MDVVDTMAVCTWVVGHLSVVAAGCAEKGEGTEACRVAMVRFGSPYCVLVDLLSDSGFRSLVRLVFRWDGLVF